MIIPMIRSKSRKTSFYSVFDMFDETSIVLEKEIFVLVKMKHTYCKEKERSKQKDPTIQKVQRQIAMPEPRDNSC